MRRLAFLTAACGLLPSMAAAQQQCAAPCYTPAQCVAPAAAAPAAAAPPRNFLRAPGTGQTAGESNSIGMRGLTLHIPEMRIGLPTVELPSLMRFRREAEMIFDHARGPLVTGDIQEFGNLPPTAAPAAAAPATAAPTCVPHMAPACGAPGCVKAESGSESIQERLARLEGLERQLAELRTACARDVAALTAAQQQAQTEAGRGTATAGAGKAGGVSSATPVRGSRPVNRSNVIQVRHQDAAEHETRYIIPAQPDQVDGGSTQPVPNGGFSSPAESADKADSMMLTKFANKLRLRK